MTKQELEQELEMLCKFYGNELSRLQSEVWYEIFKNIKKEPFHTATIRYIREDIYGKYPAPGKITAILRELYSYDENNLLEEIIEKNG
ncbi:MAG: hypothetical protein WC998_08100 [Candidatus Paceibacterota bacterium]|jgi:hypothetical protein